KADRILFAPHWSLLPNWSTIVYFTRVDRVARSPLRFEIDQAGMTDQHLVARGRCLHPVDEVTAVTRACASLSRSVDKRVKPDRFVRSFVDLVPRSFKRITLNTLRKSFTKSRGTGVVR